MTSVEEKIRQQARKLLSEKAVDLVIGYETAVLPLRTSVCFIRSPEEVGRLVWNHTCSPNLAVYLPQFFQKPKGVKGQWLPPKIGIVAKGCDSRSIVSLIRARQIDRTRLFIIGVPCESMIDRHKAAHEVASGQMGALAGAEVLGDMVRLWNTDGVEKKVKVENLLAASCLACAHRQPVISNVNLTEAASPAATSAVGYTDVAEFEAMPAEKRWEYFVSELSRCVRCYACRQACPNCYCRECFAEESSPRWLGVTTDLSDVIMFHLGRLLHQAGRCVDCGACVAACPQGIDLRLFSRKMAKDVAELFGEDSQVSQDEPETLCRFTMNDNQDFITEP